MSLSPVLVFHISAGSVALLSGTAAMSFRKGSHWHRLTGTVFVISMLSLSASGAHLGYMKHQMLNGLQGVLTFYLVATAWWTAKRRDGQTGIFDWSALPVPLAVGTGLAFYGLEAANSQTGSLGGSPAAAFLVPNVSRASLPHVLCTVHRLRVFFPGMPNIPRHIAKDARTFAAEFPAPDLDDFLAIPHSLQKCIRRTVDAARTRRLPSKDLAFAFPYCKGGTTAHRVR